jgi:uncharacterized protein involved in exopolysaccharide biosynthesis
VSEVNYANLANSALRLVGSALDLQSLRTVLETISNNEMYIAGLAGRRATAERETAAIDKQVVDAKQQADRDVAEAKRVADATRQELAVEEQAQRDAITQLQADKATLAKEVAELNTKLEALRASARAIAR